MVVLLWNDGQFERALELEALWNRLGESFSFNLLCGYPMHDFGDQDSAVTFLDVCQQHTAVTMESYARLRGEHDDAGPMVVLNGGSPGGRIDLNSSPPIGARQQGCHAVILGVSDPHRCTDGRRDATAAGRS